MAFDLTNLGETVSSGMGGAIKIVGIVVVVGLLLVIYYLYLQKKRYSEYTCIIWELDKFGHMAETKDEAGVFLDKITKAKRFFLKKGKVGLDPDKMVYIPTSKGRKICYLLKTGSKNYRFIRPTFDINSGKLTNHVGEEDVNWAILDYERQKKIFAGNELLQYLPYIVIFFCGLIILLISFWLIKKFDVLADVATQLKEASANLAAIHTNTTVIQG